MNLYQVIHTLLFTAVISLMAIIYPWTGYRQTKVVNRRFFTKTYSKVKWYLVSVTWSWIPMIVIYTAFLFTGDSFSHLGFRLPDPSINQVPYALYIISLVISSLYLLYNIYSIISLRLSSSVREHHVGKIPKNMKFLLPKSNPEKKAWVLLSITAGFTEETLYRGYLFFAIPMFFGNLHPFFIIAASAILFALGHIYQGKEVVKPSVAGLFLALIYFFTGSLYIVIILHIVQDMVAGELLREESVV